MNINIKDIEANASTGVVEFVLFDLEFEQSGKTYNYTGKHRLDGADPESENFVDYNDITKEQVSNWLLSDINTPEFKEFVILENETEQEQKPLNKPWE